MAETTTTTTGDPQALTTLLADFGIEYPNAPRPSPALLAFMRGLGLNLSQSEDVRRTGLQQVKARGAEAFNNIERSAGRNRENITGDLVRRGVLRSGEANTRFARQDEDVAAKRSEVARQQVEATTAIENAYEQARGTYRQQALERVIGAETEEATRTATQKAQEEAFKRQEEASKAAYEQQKQAQEAYLKSMEQMYAKYGGAVA